LYVSRSFFELTCFALSVAGEPRMIATVNVGNKTSRAKMEAWFKKWASEKKKREDRGEVGMLEPRADDHVSSLLAFGDRVRWLRI
jgi:DNA cross-link repair 1A protein